VVDEYLSQGREEFETLREQARRNYPSLYRKLAEARQAARRFERIGNGDPNELSVDL
jgi:hypothetical protein